MRQRSPVSGVASVLAFNEQKLIAEANLFLVSFSASQISREEAG